MKAEQRKSQEIKDVVADLLVWRSEMELRLANNERQLKDLLERNNTKGNFECLSDDFQDVAWELVTNLLHRDFGMNASASRISSYSKGKETYSTGAVVWDSLGTRHEAYLVRIHNRVEPWVMDELTTCLRRFHKQAGQELNSCKAFGVIVTTPETSPEICMQILQTGFYLAIVADETIQLALPDNFVPKEFGVAAKKKRKKEKH